MTTPQKKMSEELDSLTARYESQFAGMPRSNRNIDELDAIIADTKSLLTRIESIPEAVRPPEMNELASTVRQNITLYQRERTLIADAVTGGPEAERFATLASSANFVFARYRRHFAGQARSTRDLGALTEMVEDLESIEEGMATVIKEAIKETKKSKPELQRDLDLVRQSLKSYRTELEEIAKAREMGTPDERASMFAFLANEQFRLYKDHFAGKGRATRRPALLVRMVEQLSGIGDEMRKLKSAGLATESNDGNIGIVERQVETYNKELDEVRTARKGTAFGDLLGMLGGAANDVFEAFRNEFSGKDRKSRDLARLSALCDELNDIRKQMLDLGRAEPSATNDANVDVVTTQLTTFEQEHEQIALAQK
jgi:hypothetical protein